MNETVPNPQVTPPEPSPLGTPTPTSETLPTEKVAGTEPSPTEPPEAKPTEAPAFDLTEASLDTLRAKLPEGAQLDETLAGEFLTLLNGAKSRTELAEGLVAMQVRVANDAAQAMTEQWEATQNSWKEEMKQDAAVGGAQLEANLAKAQEVINTYADDPAAVKELFALTGAGNSVHMLKMLLKLANAVPGESAPVQGKPPEAIKPREQRLFTSPT